MSRQKNRQTPWQRWLHAARRLLAARALAGC